MAVCVLTRATCKNVRQNLIPRATAYCTSAQDCRSLLADVPSHLPNWLREPLALCGRPARRYGCKSRDLPLRLGPRRGKTVNDWEGREPEAEIDAVSRPDPWLDSAGGDTEDTNQSLGLPALQQGVRLRRRRAVGQAQTYTAGANQHWLQPSRTPARCPLSGSPGGGGDWLKADTNSRVSANRHSNPGRAACLCMKQLY